MSIPSRFNRFIRLTNREQWLLIEALLIVIGVCIGLRQCSFSSVRQAVARLADGDSPASGRASRSDVVWAVRIASRTLPGRDTCLVRALVGAALLSRWGYPGTVRIGVNQTEAAAFGAHAWVESDGEIVLGGTGAAECVAAFQPTGVV